MLAENSPEWYEISKRLNLKAAEFSKYLKRVKNAAKMVNDPKLKKEGLALAAKGDSLQAKINSLTSGYDSAYNWVRDKAGLNEVGQMGALPLIPIAIAGGAIGLLGKFISDAVVYLKKADLFLKLEKKYGGDRAASMVEKLGASGSLFSNVLKPLAPIALIGAGLYIARDRLKL